MKRDIRLSEATARSADMIGGKARRGRGGISRTVAWLRDHVSPLTSGSMPEMAGVIANEPSISRCGARGRPASARAKVDPRGCV